MVVPAGGRPTGLTDGMCLEEQASEPGDPFPTLFKLRYYDADSLPWLIGNVKIGRTGMGDGTGSRPQRAVRGQFDQVPDEGFSLGQDEQYYLELKEQVGAERLGEVLRALNDLALDPGRLGRLQDERVVRVSLLSGTTPNDVRGRLHRLAVGGEELTNYRFTYHYPDDGPRLTFNVTRDSRPPSNVHVLIGSNGVGKSRLLRHIEHLALRRPDPPPDAGAISFVGGEDEGRFTNLVSVAFSAFEDTDAPVSTGAQIGFTYVGLKRSREEGGGLKTSADLATEFAQSMRLCQEGVLRDRWQRALNELKSDRVLSDERVADWPDWEADRAAAVFARLSSGHKAVLLTLTRLVECVEEQTLVLIDEPETHLHPPLLSAFTRALSELLTDRNGVAIVATHSPVVLQEVPADCVWLLRRSGDAVGAAQPRGDTFGENVGTLTRDVFHLEVTQSGFHRMLDEAITPDSTYEEIIAEFGDKLGMEARALVQTLITVKSRRP